MNRYEPLRTSGVAMSPVIGDSLPVGSFHPRGTLLVPERCPPDQICSHFVLFNPSGTWRPAACSSGRGVSDALGAPRSSRRYGSGSTLRAGRSIYRAPPSTSGAPSADRALTSSWCPPVAKRPRQYLRMTRPTGWSLRGGGHGLRRWRRGFMVGENEGDGRGPKSRQALVRTRE